MMNYDNSLQKRMQNILNLSHFCLLFPIRCLVCVNYAFLVGERMCFHMSAVLPSWWSIYRYTKVIRRIARNIAGTKNFRFWRHAKKKNIVPKRQTYENIQFINNN